MARVLVVDDDSQIRTLFRLTLENAGHEVEDAPDGLYALDKFAEFRADVVITDIFMPEKEGLEIIIAFRRMEPDVKIIAISGGGQLNRCDYLKMAKDLGANIALSKPVKTAVLLETVERLLEE